MRLRFRPLVLLLLVALAPALVSGQATPRPITATTAQITTSLNVGCAINTSCTGGVIVGRTTSGPQISAQYDASNRLDITVASNGLTTFDSTGAGAAFTFSDGIIANGLLQVSNALFYSSVITPPNLSGTVNDYAPTGASTATFWRLNSNGANRSITGIAGGVGGRVIMICNLDTSGFLLVFNDENAGSTAANRFANGGVSRTLQGGACTEIIYDGTSARWRVIYPEV